MKAAVIVQALQALRMCQDLPPLVLTNQQWNTVSAARIALDQAFRAENLSVPVQAAAEVPA